MLVGNTESESVLPSLGQRNLSMGNGSVTPLSEATNASVKSVTPAVRALVRTGSALILQTNWFGDIQLSGSLWSAFFMIAKGDHETTLMVKD